MPARSALRAATMALLVAFAGYLAWEAVYNTPSSFAAVMSEFWGRAMLVDLYIGLAVFAAWVAHRERRPAARILWPASILVLGNLATLLYIYIALGKKGAGEAA